MPTSIIPIDPSLVIPKEGDPEDKLKDPPLKRRPEKEAAIPPDVTDAINEINGRLSQPWQVNEIRCGRAVVFGSRLNGAQLKEVTRILTESRWRVSVTVDRDGATVSVRPPESEKKRRDMRGQRGYL